MNKIIWTSYHEPTIPIRYNLKENENIKFFCTSDTLELDNINYLNEYLGEICTMYYIWKNNLKSDYIGFQHYRTLFRNIKSDKDILVENGWPGSILELFHQGGLRTHILYNSIQYLHNILNIPTTEIIHKYLIANTFCFSCNMFICKWDIFYDLCNVIFGFLDYLFPNNTWKNTDNLYSYIKDNVDMFEATKKEDDDHWYWSLGYFPHNKRYLVYFYEYFIPLYLNIKYNNEYNGKEFITDKFDNNNIYYGRKAIVCDFQNKNILLEEFTKWYELNNCCGPFKVFILNYKNSPVYDKYLENVGLFYGKYKYVQFISNIDLLEESKNYSHIYKLNIDEYIDTIAYNFYDESNYNSYNIRKILNN